MSTVNNSSLPSSIMKDSSSLDTSLNSEYVSVGPTRPKPGPILPKVAATALVALIISIPSSVRIMLAIRKSIT